MFEYLYILNRIYGISKRITYLDYISVQMKFVANGVVEYTIFIRSMPLKIYTNRIHVMYT